MKDSVNNLLIDTQNAIVSTPLVAGHEYQTHPKGLKVNYSIRMIQTGKDAGKFVRTHYIPELNEPTKAKQSRLEALCSHLLQLIDNGLS